MKERKHEAPPRYDAAFKEGAIRLVAEEGRPMREVAEELGVCTDTIRTGSRRPASSQRKPSGRTA